MQRYDIAIRRSVFPWCGKDISIDEINDEKEYQRQCILKRIEIMLKDGLNPEYSWHNLRQCVFNVNGHIEISRLPIKCIAYENA